MVGILDPVIYILERPIVDFPRLQHRILFVANDLSGKLLDVVVHHNVGRGMEIERQGAALRIGERTSLARINHVLHFRTLQIKGFGDRYLRLGRRVNLQITDLVSPGVPVVVNGVIGGGVEIRDH